MLSLRDQVVVDQAAWKQALEDVSWAAHEALSSLRAIRYVSYNVAMLYTYRMAVIVMNRPARACRPVSADPTLTSSLSALRRSGGRGERSATWYEYP